MAQRTTPPNQYFVGRRGGGKSYAARALSGYRPKVVYVDPTSTVTDMTYTDTDPERLAARMRTETLFRGCLWTSHMTVEQMQEAVQVMTDEAQRDRDTLTTIIIDEYAVIYPNRFAAKPVMRAARTGRHSKVSFWLCSQRLVDAAPETLAIIDRLNIFQCAAPNDYRYARLSLSGKELEEAIKNLGQFEYIAYDTGTAQWEKRKPVP